MDTHRTCSFAGSLTAVSWRFAESVAPGIVASVAVVATPLREGGEVVATITLRLTVPSARLRLSVDGRHVASIEVSCSLEPGTTRGHLFRDEVAVPLEFLDGRTHLLEVNVDADEDEDDDETSPGRLPEGAIADRISLARHETAFYARRVSTRDSRREFAAAREWGELGILKW